jgi:hypothetical protein
VDGDGGGMQDGEGWTPRDIHQSVGVAGTIYYRPLASEQPTPPANKRACRASSVEAFKRPARLVSFCKATADSVRSSVGNLRPWTNDQRADARRSRPRWASVPLRSWLLHRSRVEDSGASMQSRSREASLCQAQYVNLKKRPLIDGTPQSAAVA